MRTAGEVPDIVDTPAAWPFLRPDLAENPAVPHGGTLDEARALGRNPASIIDLSANTSPLGVPPAVQAAVASAVLGRYPEPDARPLCVKLAEAAGVGVDQVVAGNGSIELIWLAVLATLRPGMVGAVLGPTFGEYARAIRIAGGTVRHVDAGRPAFTPPLLAFGNLLATARPAVAFLANPNNPTGQMITAEEVERLARFAPATLLVVDEAYVPFSDASESLTRLLRLGNVLLLRSMTKEFGVPGVRLGYALASPAVAAALRAVAPPWSVSAPAIAAGLACLGDKEWSRLGCRVAREQIARLDAGLRQRGLMPVPTAANYLIVRVDDAQRVRRHLLNHGIIVRDCTSFGLPEYLRIAAAPPAAIDRLLAAWPSEAGT